MDIENNSFIYIMNCGMLNYIGEQKVSHNFQVHSYVKIGSSKDQPYTRSGVLGQCNAALIVEHLFLVPNTVDVKQVEGQVHRALKLYNLRKYGLPKAKELFVYNPAIFEVIAEIVSQNGGRLLSTQEMQDWEREEPIHKANKKRAAQARARANNVRIAA